MREPWFWRDHSLAGQVLSSALTPVSLVYDFAQKARHFLTQPEKSKVPIFCVGNATLGGVGKTPMAILLSRLFSEAGLRPLFLTRGYGGAAKGATIVDMTMHDHSIVGDEALLLARHGNVVTSIDRVRGLRTAETLRPDVIILDDGFQNPAIGKDCSILLIRPEDMAGNNRLFPAGPLREPFSRAQRRADITVAVDNVARPDWADYRAWLAPVNTPAAQPVIAFCGIGAPLQFFAHLEAGGFEIKKRFAFPDHHPYSEADIKEIITSSEAAGAAIITTEKDAVRVPENLIPNLLEFPVEMKIDDLERFRKTILEKFETK